MLTISIFLHVTAAMFWVGGMLFLTLVVAPFLISINDEAKKREIYQAVGTRYRFWGWAAIITMLVTGPANLYYMGMTPAMIFDPAFHATAYGKTLMAKISFVLLIVASSLIHDFWIGPGARTNRAYSRYARIIGRANLFLALIIVILAVLLRTNGM